ncbi:uncharacterized protein LOC129589521 [Paramacrobiotus metropolitanus]|uniref:uncharacterized protein LOC129589521 n=1 Tax=Paramacrobiotus metropolitanus TaxID=2943436 RepID=UPI0024457DE4|nr:uncharacterized protein LOC129589521 [Paramacrobiotus metropolitanus]
MSEMAVQSALNTYFSTGRRRGCFNLGYAVMVNLISDELYLGFLQDTDEERLFIDFDCADIAPCWVAAKQVWMTSSHAYGHLNTLEEMQYEPLHVALRNTPTGPYVYRPGKLAQQSTEGNLFLSCVVVDNLDNGEDFYVVHPWQIADTNSIPRFPTDESNYQPHPRKVVIPVSTMELLDIDEYRVIRMLDMVFRGGRRERSYQEYADRLFVRINAKSLYFLIGHIQCSHVSPLCCPNEWESNWSWKINTAERIAVGVEYYLSQYCGKPERCPGGRECSISDCTEDHELFEYMPPEIISFVLESLDIHSKVRAKRTCALWDLLLPDPAFNACIILDLANLSTQWPLYRKTEGYLLARLLHHTVNRNTHALVLHNLFHRNTDNGALNNYYLLLIVQLLKIKCILPLIMLMNLRVRVGRLYPTDEDNPDDENWSVMYFHALDLTDVCQRLFIRNYTVDFDASPYSADFLGCAFQHPMPGFVESRGSFSMSIRIPEMSLPYARGKAEKAECLQQFKSALMAHCPPVDPAVRKRVMDLHANWVKMVPYPGPQWLELRQLLKFYGTYKNPKRRRFWRFWRKLDVRHLDGDFLGNLQLIILGREYPDGADLAPIPAPTPIDFVCYDKGGCYHCGWTECTDTRISRQVFFSVDEQANQCSTNLCVLH